MRLLAYFPFVSGIAALIWLALSMGADRRAARAVLSQAPSRESSLPEADHVEWNDPQAAKTLYLSLRADFTEHLRFSADQVELLQAHLVSADRKLRLMERELKYLRAEVGETEDRLTARARQAESVAEAAVQRFAVNATVAPI